jgi:hypothetical protein
LDDDDTDPKPPSRFPTHLLPQPLHDYVEQAAMALGCDPAYIAVPLLPVIASAIGNTRRIRLKSTWTEPSVIWAAVVGDSGTAKSPALELALRPVWRQQRDALRAHAAARLEYKAAVTNWNQSKNKFGNTPLAEPRPPESCQHFICLDITIEALADRLLASPRGTLVAPDELAGWFGSFNQYKAGGADVAHWLSLFGARPLKVDRKSPEKPTIYVPQAAVSITGTIQPDTLRRALTPEFFCNGLAARILLVMPPVTPKRWTDREIDPVTDRLITLLFDNLFAMKSCAGVSGEDEPVMVDLNPDGLKAWVDFVNQHGHRMDAMDTTQRAAHSKLEGYAARLALVMHCVRQITREKQNDYIDQQDINHAVELVRWFGDQTKHVYARLLRSVQEQTNVELLELIKRKGGVISERELARGPIQYRKADAASTALQKLVDDGWGKWFYPIQDRAGGHPGRHFQLFP